MTKLEKQIRDSIILAKESQSRLKTWSIEQLINTTDRFRLFETADKCSTFAIKAFILNSKLESSLKIK